MQISNWEIPRNLKLIFFLLVFTEAHSQENTFPLNSPQSVDDLVQVRRKAQENAANNLNRFALEKMRYYDALLDSFVLSEKKDTLTKIEQEYYRISSSRNNNIANL